MPSSGWWDQGAEPALKGKADQITDLELAPNSVGDSELKDGAVKDSKPDTGVRLVGASLGTPSLASATRFLNAATMKATPYTVANGGALPAGNPPRNISVTHATVNTTDTLGSLHVEGTDYADQLISEDITIVADSVAYGAKAFKTVTLLQTSGWVIGGATADNLSVGFGPLLGLPRKLSAAAQVFLALLNGLVINAPTIAVSASSISNNTVDLSSGTYDGSKIAKALLAP